MEEGRDTGRGTGGEEDLISVGRVAVALCNGYSTGRSHEKDKLVQTFDKPRNALPETQTPLALRISTDTPNLLQQPLCPLPDIGWEQLHLLQ